MHADSNPGITHSTSDLLLTEVAPRIEVRQLSGSIDGVDESDDFERIVVADPPPNIDLPLVHPSSDEIDLGVELRTAPKGARILDVADEVPRS